MNEELCDAVAFLDEVFAIGMIEQENFHFAAVLGIDHPGSAIDAVFDRHAAAGPDEADMAVRQRQTDAGVDQHFPACGDDGVYCGIQVRSRITGIGVGGGYASCNPANGFRFVDCVHLNIKKPRRKTQGKVDAWVGQTR